ncbi:hypothetical protein [Gudongella sp. SC589]|jgi:hypothetical protein|uniref:hypothetical protein n=1 Tax=Gudongella sp. SC589 TaxID=3385990 RepID=UPI0039047677
MFIYILKRVAMLVSIMLMLLGTVFYFSDSIKYEPMINVIEEDYPQYEFYSTQPEEYEDLEIDYNHILAFHNLEFNMFDKDRAVNEPRIEVEVTRGMDSQQVIELRNQIGLLSGDIHDYYFPRAFFRYARGHYAVFLIVAAFETIRIMMAGDRERRRNVKR